MVVCLCSAVCWGAVLSAANGGVAVLVAVQVLQATGTQGIYDSVAGKQNSVISFANTANRIRNEFFR